MEVYRIIFRIGCEIFLRQVLASNKKEAIIKFLFTMHTEPKSFRISAHKI